MIACGEAHSLALTDKQDVYAWGRGFEGQLGIQNVPVAATPQYVKAFFRKVPNQGFERIPIKFIECGAFYSLAISESQELYGWGESRMGQLGLGKKSRQVPLPTKIHVMDQPD